MTSDRKAPIHPPEKKGSKRGDKPRTPEPSLVDDPIQQAIGGKLKAVFDQVTSQPVPERFTELLRQLEEQERREDD